jgi:hypothetical protein
MTNQCPGIKGIASLPRENAVAKPTRPADLFGLHLLDQGKQPLD